MPAFRLFQKREPTMLSLLIGALFIAFFLCTFNTGISFGELLSQPTYYRDLALSTLFAWGLMWMVQVVSQYFDKVFSWENNKVKRIFGQLGLGGLLPSLLALLFSYLQYRFLIPDHVFGLPSFWEVEFPVMLLFILLVNVFFIFYSFYKKWERGAADLKAITEKVENKERKSTIMVEKGRQKMSLPVETIAFAHLNKGITKIVTKNQESYLSKATLNQLSQQLTAPLFFRANRQYLVNKAICKSYRTIEHGKIQLRLFSPFEAVITISQKTAPAFRQWMKNGR